MSGECPRVWTACRAWRNIESVKEQQSTVGRLYDLIQAHLDSQEYEVSERQLAQRLGVSPTTVANWREPKKLIAKEHLEAIARVTRVPYSRVLQALLEDIGYWDEGSGGSGRDAASIGTTKRARSSGRPRSRRQVVEQLQRALEAGAIDQAEFDRRVAELDEPDDEEIRKEA